MTKVYSESVNHLDFEPHSDEEGPVVFSGVYFRPEKKHVIIDSIEGDSVPLNEDHLKQLINKLSSFLEKMQ